MVYRVSERRYAGWLIADLESKSEGCCVQFDKSRVSVDDELLPGQRFQALLFN